MTKEEQIIKQEEDKFKLKLFIITVIIMIISLGIIFGYSIWDMKKKQNAKQVFDQAVIEFERDKDLYIQRLRIDVAKITSQKFYEGGGAEILNKRSDELEELFRKYAKAQDTYRKIIED